MKRLTISWSDLDLAFEAPPVEIGLMEQTNLFDLETGNVCFLWEEDEDALDAIEEELSEELGDDAEFTEEAIRGTQEFQDLPEWRHTAVLAAAMLRYGDPGRFQEIPQFDLHQSFQFMDDFVETVEDAAVRRKLSKALVGGKPFRRFRDAMEGDRRLERQWREFENRRKRDAILEWLHSIGVTPANPEPDTAPPPLPELRKIMFAEVRRFVRFARDVPGVERVALIGSLATEKEFPRDMDLLVTIRDDCDLARLAQLGRELYGHMLGHQAGADVFLADPQGEYLGRTCPWKRCGRGIRMSCDALHCGERPYLHDDLETVRLSQKVIDSPPVLLWPELAAAGAVPDDVREQLIEPLRQDAKR